MIVSREPRQLPGCTTLSVLSQAQGLCRNHRLALKAFVPLDPGEELSSQHFKATPAPLKSLKPQDAMDSYSRVPVWYTDHVKRLSSTGQDIGERYSIDHQIFKGYIFNPY